MQRARLGKVVILVALLTTLASSGRAKLPETLISRTRPSPDSRWKVTWRCQETPTPKCSVIFSRVSDGRVFFRHSTFPCYIQAVWNRNSTKCLLLDAPDNANTFLWLFQIRNRHATTETLDYEAISAEIEQTRPEARRSEPQVTRSGVEKITWNSDSEVSLHITYNNVSVVVHVDTSKPGRPRITVVF
jgi:hypothetical protein